MLTGIVIFGPPGAGKGTQAERVASARGLPKISTGDMLRRAAQQETELGHAVRNALAAGQLVSDRVMADIVTERLGRPDVEKGFVLDGYPRTRAQAQRLDELIAGRGVLLVVAMDVPAEVVVKRLTTRKTCRRCELSTPPVAAEAATCPRCDGELVTRSDDHEPVIRERLEVYKRETQPLVDYYRSRPNFFRIDGDRPPDDVSATLEQILAGARTGRPGSKAKVIP